MLVVSHGRKRCFGLKGDGGDGGDSVVPSMVASCGEWFLGSKACGEGKRMEEGARASERQLCEAALAHTLAHHLALALSPSVPLRRGFASDVSESYPRGELS